MIEKGDVEERMVKVREGRDYEGEVLYFMDSNNNTVGLLKKKTTWYIVLRAIREKVSHVWSTYRYIFGKPSLLSIIPAFFSILGRILGVGATL